MTAKGGHISAETRARMSAEAKKKWTPERRAALGAKMRGRRMVKPAAAEGSTPVPAKESAPPPEPSSQPPTQPAPPPLPSINVSSALPPPSNRDLIVPPTPGILPTPPSPVQAAQKAKLWEPRKATGEEFSELTEAISGLIQKGWAGLATYTEWDGWIHSEDDMRPYKRLIRFVLQRFLFDPSMLLIILAVVEIAEQEMVRAGQYSRWKKSHPSPEAPGPAPAPARTHLQPGDLLEVPAPA